MTNQEEEIRKRNEAEISWEGVAGVNTPQKKKKKKKKVFSHIEVCLL